MKKIALILAAVLLLGIAAGAGADTDPIICAGGSFMYARDNQGQWYVWGDNQFGQLGRGNKTQKKTVFEFMSKNETIDPSQIRTVCAGCDYSFLLMEDGTIYGVGNGSNGLMSGGIQITHKIQNYQDPTIVQMSSGFGHTLVLNEAGEVHAWGRNNAGQVGNGSKKSPWRESAALVELPAKVTKVAAGGKFSVALDENGVLWGWGDNANHEISPDKTKAYRTPVQIDTGDLKIVDVNCGGSCVAIVDENGDLYMWGVNDNCQCGFEDKKKADVLVPTKVELPLPVVFLQAYSSQIYVVLTDGSLWSWGNNAYGQLGVGYRSAAGVGVPVNKVYDSRVVSVTSGSLFMVAMLEDGTLISTGMNKFGQLGREAPYWGDANIVATDIDLIK